MLFGNDKQSERNAKLIDSRVDTRCVCIVTYKYDMMDAHAVNSFSLTALKQTDLYQVYTLIAILI